MGKKEKIKLTKDYLQRLYIDEERTMKEIGELTGYSVGYVHKIIHGFGIEREQKITQRTRQKLSSMKIGKTSPLKGRHLSEDVIRKLSESHKGVYKRPSEFGGHTKKRSDGYIKVYVPDHPYATKDGYVMEHILVMEKAIGRYITREEVVHHKNHIKNDNRLENLELMTLSKHAKLHISERHRNKQIKYHTVEVKNTTTGEVFHSCLEAAKKYQVAPTRISKACRQRLKLKGCEWEYLKEE